MYTLPPFTGSSWIVIDDHNVSLKYSQLRGPKSENEINDSPVSLDTDLSHAVRLLATEVHKLGEQVEGMMSKLGDRNRVEC